MSIFDFGAKPKILPVLDKDFRPASLENRAFLEAVKKLGQAVLSK